MRRGFMTTVADLLLSVVYTAVVLFLFSLVIRFNSEVAEYYMSDWIFPLIIITVLVLMFMRKRYKAPKSESNNNNNSMKELDPEGNVFTKQGSYALLSTKTENGKIIRTYLNEVGCITYTTQNTSKHSKKIYAAPLIFSFLVPAAAMATGMDRVLLSVYYNAAEYFLKGIEALL